MSTRECSSATTSKFGLGIGKNIGQQEGFVSGRSFEIFDGILVTLLTLGYFICYLFVGLSDS